MAEECSYNAEERGYMLEERGYMLEELGYMLEESGYIEPVLLEATTFATLPVCNAARAVHALHSDQLNI
jgi:hypothetical protein